VAADDEVLWLDPATMTVRLVPAASLTPGLIRIRLNDIDEDVWADPKLIQQSPLRHPPFSEEVRELLRMLKSTLDEVYPMSLEGWEEGFRRDANPEPEIALWLHIAEVYAAVTTPDLSLAERRDRFRFLMACANGSREQIGQTAPLGSLDPATAAQIVERFYGPSPAN
jgi:hypothetical protein